MAALWKELLRILIVTSCTNFVLLQLVQVVILVGTPTILACIPRPLSHGNSNASDITVGSHSWLTNNPLLSIASRRLYDIVHPERKNKTNKPFSTFCFLLGLNPKVGGL